MIQNNARDLGELQKKVDSWHNMGLDEREIAIRSKDEQLKSKLYSTCIYLFRGCLQVNFLITSVDEIFTIYLCIFFFLICFRNISLSEKELIVLADFLNWCMGI